MQTSTNKIQYSRLNFALCLVFVFAFLTVCSTAVYGLDKWWQRQDEGWFFYRDSGKAREAAKKNIEKDQKPMEKPLTAEEMKKEAERLLSKAVIEPSETNLKEYMEYQKKMLNLADRFAVVWQRVLMKYPELYASVSTEGVNEEIEKSVMRLREKAGLFFIYSSTCPHCQKEALVIEDFKRKYDFIVIPISIDGGILPGFPDTRYDNGISSRLGIQSVPAIFLAYPGEDRFEHIGTGFIPLPDLERRLYYYAVTEDFSYNYPAAYSY